MRSASSSSTAAGEIRFLREGRSEFMRQPVRGEVGGRKRHGRELAVAGRVELDRQAFAFRVDTVFHRGLLARRGYTSRTPLLTALYMGTRVGDKHLCVAVKVVDNDAFILTAYLVRQPAGGKQLWPNTRTDTKENTHEKNTRIVRRSRRCAVCASRGYRGRQREGDHGVRGMPRRQRPERERHHSQSRRAARGLPRGA